MTQYLLSVHGGHENPYSSEEEMQQAFADVEKFNSDLQNDGAWVFGGGLEPADQSATVVDNTGGTPITTDGPYLESKEHLGGFWIIDVPDLDAALKYAAQGSKACKGKVEVRPFQGE